MNAQPSPQQVPVPQPQPMQPKQVTYPSTFIDVQPTPTGDVMLIVNAPGSGEVLVFPMGADAAKEIGGKLMAPRIQVAPAGAVNGNGGGH